MWPLKSTLGFLPILSVMLLLAGCATPSFIPPLLWSQVDQDLTFADLQRSPDSYVGKLVLLGGEVISTRQVEKNTWIEVLQLPLYASEAPWWDRETSEGRFVALQTKSLDPSTIPPGTLVSVVGEVIGRRYLPDGQVENQYPAIDISLLKRWPWKADSEDWFVIYWYYYRGMGLGFTSGSAM